jgi:16S rRNA processing protein RimM
LAAPDRLICVGVFGAAHGVRGQLRVKSYTQDPKAIGAYGDLTDEARARTFRFIDLRPLKDDMLVARLAGLDRREDAEKLTGVRLFARRGQLPPPSDDEFYWDDLVGLEAVTREGERLGRVVALQNFGAGDILEIAPDAGGESLLLPFAKAVAVAIDFDAGRIVVVPPNEVEGELRDGEA